MQPVTTRNPNMLRGETSAEYRRMGYTAGTILVGNEGYGDTYLKITAIGEKNLLARSWSERQGYGFEGLWTLAYRDWKKTDQLPLPETLTEENN